MEDVATLSRGSLNSLTIVKEYIIHNVKFDLGKSSTDEFGAIKIQEEINFIKGE